MQVGFVRGKLVLKHMGQGIVHGTGSWGWTGGDLDRGGVEAGCLCWVIKSFSIAISSGCA